MLRFSTLMRMDIALLLSFWGISVLMTCIPGPDWGLILRHVIGSDSRAAVNQAVAGIGAGYVVMSAVVAAGVGVIVTQHPAVFTIISVGGAVLLTYLGATMLWGLRPAARVTAGAQGQVRGDKASSPVWEGMGVSLLNPKAIMFFVAMLPQFVNTQAAWSVSTQMFTLGMAFTVSVVAMYTGLSLAARRVLRANERAAVVMQALGGVAMLVLAAVMVGEVVIGL
ncbi:MULTISPECIES: LysE family translocator [unclassified Corynebacterium]|uniref:LysE family translocator n=1 Tax=unclassified Corynebacterium TaxID=2624378 RepID=UPI0029CAA1A0|nr:MULTISPECIES: LysE family translocator [unclassified Corynebacterium]WPF65764.1 LysE family translocator [Corynebacterium sp. 22KM0430]WPF68258.1 LysE family translocator [Corynebacterium sp. 21KM1197]